MLESHIRILASLIIAMTSALIVGFAGISVISIAIMAGNAPAIACSGIALLWLITSLFCGYRTQQHYYFACYHEEKKADPALVVMETSRGNVFLRHAVWQFGVAVMSLAVSVLMMIGLRYG